MSLCNYSRRSVLQGTRAQKETQEMPTNQACCCALWKTFQDEMHLSEHANQNALRSLEEMSPSEGLQEDYEMGKGQKILPAVCQGQSAERGKGDLLQEL